MAANTGLEEKLVAVRAYFAQPIHELLHPRLLLYLIPPAPSWRWTLVLLIFAIAVIARVYCILPTQASGADSTKNARESAASVAVFLGSGGHTTELLQLVSALPTSRYPHRIYMMSTGDQFSLQKAQELERTLHDTQHRISILQIPRARRVHQGIISTPFTLLQSILFCILHIAIQPLVKGVAQQGTFRDAVYSDLIMMNGPGTCVPIVAAVYLVRILGLKSPKLIYIESFARVKSLSLTAKLIRPFVDRFVLQWPPTPSTKHGKGIDIHSGWLI